MALPSAHVDVAPAGIKTSWSNDLGVSDDDVRRARRCLLVTAILALLGGAGAIIVRPVATLTITRFIGWILVRATSRATTCSTTSRSTG